jgi:uncharacterized protein (DUF2141 family)
MGPHFFVGALVAGLLVAAAIPPGEMASPPDEMAKKYHPIEFHVRTDPDRGGDILCALYRNEDNWLTDTTYRDAATPAGKKTSICRFPSVPRGNYAIASLHDEDRDGEMDTNFIGLPQEGYAASRNAHLKGIGAPDWEDAIFPHRSRKTVQRARMKY